jgi:hypothetical protein
VTVELDRSSDLLLGPMANNGAYQNERLGRVDEEDKLQGGSSITEKTRTRSQGRNELRYELSTSPWPEEH